ncbi:LAGLIDADG family homing endonuclease [Spirillospora sp. NPDC127200]
MPNIPFGRDFWIGCLSGLIDTDGCVRRRRNQRGYTHGCIEFASTSHRLAQQASDAMLRLGIPNILRTRKHDPRPWRIGKSIGKSNHDLHVVEVNSKLGCTRSAQLLKLRISHKAATLAALAEEISESPGKSQGPAK